MPDPLAVPCLCAYTASLPKITQLPVGGIMASGFFRVWGPHTCPVKGAEPPGTLQISSGKEEENFLNVSAAHKDRNLLETKTGF